MKESQRSWLWWVTWILIPVVVPAAIFHVSIIRFCEALSFPESALREYEEIFAGEGMAENPTWVPYRTGKVVVVKPSVHAVYATGGVAAETLFWTQIAPAHRPRISRELDPPALDESWYLLDPSLRATSPDEVDTLIFCETRKLKEGVYVSKDPSQPGPVANAYRFDKYLKVYDWRNRRFLGSYLVAGTPAPEETTILGRHAGEAPEVHTLIERLELRR
jgi:hypothetical protein